MKLIDAEVLERALIKSHDYHADNARELSLLARDVQILREQLEIDAMPVRHARWKFIQRSRDGSKEYQCTDCKRYVVLYHMDCNYCPYCGAKMDGEEKL